MGAHKNFQGLNIAVLTVSDTRTHTTETSGNYLAESLQASGHKLAQKQIVPDDIYQIRAAVSGRIASAEIDAILLTGGTGFTLRDSTPEALLPLFGKVIEGFGKLFRAVSAAEIGPSTIQSRAIAGLANNTVIFCMPGSTGACKAAWINIIQEQLDSRHSPCNFVGVLKTRIRQRDEV